MTKAAYIHIPFCHRICSYCDFCKMYYKSDWVDNYLKALEKEIKTFYKQEKLSSIYIGGGTPSCLNKKELIKLFKIIKSFNLFAKYEFTFECNIEDINLDLLKTLKENKVNRLSIGVQTINTKYLNLMNRTIDSDIKNKIELCKSYFDNISIDLMYGFYGETMNDLNNDLQFFINLNIPHISIYCLILEENTKLKTQNYQELDDDKQRDMYDLIRKVLKKSNYKQYEISNFAKTGFDSKHNLNYWNNEEYYGFGLGASGFVNNMRYTNTRNFNAYLKQNYSLESYSVTLKENMENEMILGLRKTRGVSKKQFFKKYKKNIFDVFDTSLLKENKNYYHISSKDLYISNSILINFIDI